MTAPTVKLIITAQVAHKKVELGQVDIQINKKLDESIYQGMQCMRKTLYTTIMHGVDDGLRETAPAGWKNVGRELVTDWLDSLRIIKDN